MCDQGIEQAAHSDYLDRMTDAERKTYRDQLDREAAAYFANLESTDDWRWRCWKERHRFLKKVLRRNLLKRLGLYKKMVY
jgi:hypothetical protein